MKRLFLYPGATASTSLGFGTTSLVALPTSKERLSLLEAAFESGIRHFDTAPYYGYGEAERILGAFVVGRRDQLTITTKYGIEPPAVIKSRLVNLLARKVLRALPFLRNALSRQAKALTKKRAFTSAAARRSLDQSLTALKTDYVDLFLLHEPSYEDAASEEMHEFLRNEVIRGRIRAFGCGGEFDVIQNIAIARPPTSTWLQFEDNVLNPRVDRIRMTGARCITYRTFHQALRTVTRWLEAAPIRYAEWESQLDIDLRSEGVLAGLLLASSQSRNPDGIVLFSTRQGGRIRNAARIASGRRFSEEQIGKFETLARGVCAPRELHHDLS